MKKPPVFLAAFYDSLPREPMQCDNCMVRLSALAVNTRGDQWLNVQNVDTCRFATEKRMTLLKAIITCDGMDTFRQVVPKQGYIRFEERPICFMRAHELGEEMSGTGQADRLEVIQKERDCDMATPWQQGFSPKEHWKMKLEEEAERKANAMMADVRKEAQSMREEAKRIRQTEREEAKRIRQTERDEREEDKREARRRSRWGVFWSIACAILAGGTIPFFLPYAIKAITDSMSQKAAPPAVSKPAGQPAAIPASKTAPQAPKLSP